MTQFLGLVDKRKTYAFLIIQINMFGDSGNVDGWEPMLDD